MNIKQIFKSMLVAGLVGVTVTTHAAVERMDEHTSVANPNEEKAYLAGSLKAKYPTTKFSEINHTPMPGIYELVTGKTIFYTDKEGAYLIMGSMFDMANSRDLTAERKEQLNKLDFSTLDPKNAIVEVKGDGTRQLAILTDVDCPYCKQLEGTLKNVTNVTIYRYLYPIASLHPNAHATSAAIWCLGDNEKRLTAMANYMERGMKPNAESNCDLPIAAIEAFAKKHEIFGTPSLINGNGNILPGAAPLDRIEAFLSSGSPGTGAAVVVTDSGLSN